MNHVAILWPWFGTFEVMPTRVKDKLKEEVEEYKNNKKVKSNAEEKTNPGEDS